MHTTSIDILCFVFSAGLVVRLLSPKTYLLYNTASEKVNELLQIYRAFTSTQGAKSYRWEHFGRVALIYVLRAGDKFR